MHDVCGIGLDEDGYRLDVRGIIKYDAHESNGYSFDASKGPAREMGVTMGPGGGCGRCVRSGP